ncbi:hypothetical protein [Cellvibrio mixtus]|uniref:hypothetical protein n=1 Tax=Cellvibrio mixtus TaxID=39650 RepID=UPI000586B862|nr:hypothetical protein [Cellvibrio mixtus]
MDVSRSSIANLYNFTNSLARNRDDKAQALSLFPLKASSPDKVTISEQGKALSNQEVPEELLKMAMAPGWYQDLLPISSKLGVSESYSNGHFARMETYRETFKNELSEYGKIFNEAFEATKKEFGINTQNDMYEKVIKNPEYSESLRQAFEQKVTAAPRGLELMSILGIKRK